ncbi:MAG TPA: extracellular solute-binding protein, partial [Candidatus Ozemobacteraceae bacterium]|nr:extracellular solute-binding protein [Candidatus Ozemobacteraceae bacterium]
PDGWWFEPFLFGFGGSYFENDKLSFQSEATIKATHFLIDLKETAHALPPVNLRTSSYDVMMTSFKNGQVSMVINGPWAIREAFAGQAFKENVSNLLIAPLPKGPAGFYTPVGCQTWVVPSSCKNRKEAIELIKFLSSTEAMAVVCKKNYSIPARQSLFNDPELRKDPFLAPFLRQMQECRPHPNDHADRGELYTLIGEYLVKVLSGDVTPEDGLKDLTAAWKGKK